MAEESSDAVALQRHLTSPTAKLPGCESSAEQLADAGAPDYDAGAGLGLSGGARATPVGPASRAPVFFISCTDRDVCSPPSLLPGARVGAPPPGTREAKLLWRRPHLPRRVLLVKKWRDPEVTAATAALGRWIREHTRAEVYTCLEAGDDAPLDPAEFPPIALHSPACCGAAEADFGHWNRGHAGAEAKAPLGGSCAGEASDGAGQEATPDCDAAAHPAAASPAAAGGASGGSGGVSVDSIDLIVCLGGDGTVLHISSRFHGAVPPILALAFGSLGFLTVHSESSALRTLAAIFGLQLPVSPALPPEGGAMAAAAPSEAAPAAGVAPAAPATAASEGRGGEGEARGASALGPVRDTAQGTAPSPVLAGAADSAAPLTLPRLCLPCTPAAVPVSLRMRLLVTVHRGGQHPDAPPAACHAVLNELLVERGGSPYMAALNLWVDDEPLTTVSADGIILATQTGSTAYALSAGGSILAPNCDSIILAPICPHSLSFRPIVFSDTTVLRLEVPLDARASAVASFDGRASVTLNRGDYVTVRASPWPLPLLSRRSAMADFIKGIRNKLLWNTRGAMQKPFAAASSGLAGSGGGGAAGAGAAGASRSRVVTTPTPRPGPGLGARPPAAFSTGGGGESGSAGGGGGGGGSAAVSSSRTGGGGGGAGDGAAAGGAALSAPAAALTGPPASAAAEAVLRAPRHVGSLVPPSLQPLARSFTDRTTDSEGEGWAGEDSEGEAEWSPSILRRAGL